MRAIWVNDVLYIPKVAISEDGNLIGDGMVPIGEGDPEYQEWKDTTAVKIGLPSILKMGRVSNDINILDNIEENEAKTIKHLGNQHDQQTHAGGTTDTKGRHFHDLKEGDKLPEHIARLRIPPAWKDVRYSPDPDADLLVIGQDAKGRGQTIYSERFSKQQADKKFARIAEMAKKFEGIQKQNQDAMAKSKDRDVVEAASCLQLIMHTGIRPGSDTDTKAKLKAYGATTLEGRHVKTRDGKVSLDFVGKKGVSLSIPIEDKTIAKSLTDRAKKAGDTGRLFGIDNGQLLAYTHSLDGGKFKTKDFRTYLGTRMAMDLVKGSKDQPKTMKEYKKAVRDVADVVSKKLGNTITVALQSYINPVVFAGWRGGL